MSGKTLWAGIFGPKVDKVGYFQHFFQFFEFRCRTIRQKRNFMWTKIQSSSNRIVYIFWYFAAINFGRVIAKKPDKIVKLTYNSQYIRKQLFSIRRTCQSALMMKTKTIAKGKMFQLTRQAAGISGRIQGNVSTQFQICIVFRLAWWCDTNKQTHTCIYVQIQKYPLRLLENIQLILSFWRSSAKPVNHFGFFIFFGYFSLKILVSKNNFPKKFRL